MAAGTMLASGRHHGHRLVGAAAQLDEAGEHAHVVLAVFAAADDQEVAAARCAGRVIHGTPPPAAWAHC